MTHYAGAGSGDGSRRISSIHALLDCRGRNFRQKFPRGKYIGKRVGQPATDAEAQQVWRASKVQQHLAFDKRRRVRVRSGCPGNSKSAATVKRNGRFIAGRDPHKQPS